MRILLGIDDPAQSKKVISFLARLQFPHATVDAVHVIESLHFPGRRELPDPVWKSMEFAQQRRDEGSLALVEQAVADLKAVGLQGTPHCRRGLAADRLIDFAAEANDKLIAVGSVQKNAVQALFGGSVSRGLAIGAQRSLLVIKHEHASSGPITAVLATDHSAYMNDCLDRLAEMAPQGIGRLIILTAYEVNSEDLESLQAHDSDLAARWVQDFEQRLHERNHALCTRLRSLGISCEAQVINGAPIPVINSVMRQSKAELLILGAQGHSLGERLTIGSLSFHEVVAEPHSVLVLRC